MHTHTHTHTRTYPRTSKVVRTETTEYGSRKNMVSERLLIDFRAYTLSLIRSSATGEGRALSIEKRAFYLEDVLEAIDRRKDGKETSSGAQGGLRQGLLRAAASSEAEAQTGIETGAQAHVRDDKPKPGTIQWENGAVGGSLSFMYHAYLRPLLQRIGSICLVCLSLTVLASEIEVLLVAGGHSFTAIGNDVNHWLFNATIPTDDESTDEKPWGVALTDSWAPVSR